jgi:hypothetical protein
MVVGAERVPEVRVRLPLISRLLDDVKASELPSVALMMRLWYEVAKLDIAKLSEALSPSPMNSTVEPYMLSIGKL